MMSLFLRPIFYKLQSLAVNQKIFTKGDKKLLNINEQVIYLPGGV